MAKARRSHSRDERVTLSPSIAASAFAIFALAGLAGKAGMSRNVDRAVRRRIHSRKSVQLTRVATAVSLIGAPRSRAALAGSLALGSRALGARDSWRIIAAAVLATALNKSTRLMLRKKRPPGAGVHRGLDVFAYPSGHCCAVAAVTTAAVQQLSTDQSAAVRAALIAGAAGVSLATAWSRLYLDEHWMDDVIGGLCAGLGIGLMVRELGARTGQEELLPS